MRGATLNERMVAQNDPYVNDNMRLTVRTQFQMGIVGGLWWTGRGSAPKRLMVSARYVAKTPQCVWRVVDGPERLA